MKLKFLLLGKKYLLNWDKEMVIREAGIMIRGFPVVYSTYHQTKGERKIDIVLRSALLSGILSFLQSTSKYDVEYIESNKYTIAFKKGLIQSNQPIDPDIIVAYVILDKEKKVDAFISKKVIPQLNKVLNLFIKYHSGKNFSNVKLFWSFRKVLDRYFLVDSKSSEEKFKTTFL